MRGLALEGGGAKGAFHIGAIKALKELGIDYDGVVGTSIGAVNGALIAMGDLERLESLWLGTSMKDVINGDEMLLEKAAKLDFSSEMEVHKIARFFIDTLKQGGLDITPFKKILREMIDEKRLRDSDIDYGLVTLSLNELKPIEIFINEIPEGSLHDYIMASANLPVFKIDKVENKTYLDGAMVDNLPINMLVDKGYDEIIAIRVMGFGRTRRVKNKEKINLITITPSEDLGKILEINKERAAYNIKMGYYDTLRVFKKLKGTRYYIAGEIDEELVFQELLRIKDEILLEVGRLIGSKKSSKRLLFEDLVPLIKELLEDEDTATYGEIALSLYEFLASEMEIDRFRILTFKQLVGLVHRRYREEKVDLSSKRGEFANKLIGFLSVKTNMLFPQKLKKETLKHIFSLLFENGFLMGEEDEKNVV